MSSTGSSTMSIALAEAEKYEVLERIGNILSTIQLSSVADKYIGSGSFGVIRKVKRKSDGEVSISSW